MKKLFIQFFLLLFACFVVMTLLVGLVYKVTAERAGRQSMDDLMKSSLYLIRNELRTIPPRDWHKTINQLDLNLSFKLQIEPLDKYSLPAQTRQRLNQGEIVALDNEYTFIQRIPRSHYVLAVGPIPYLFFLHEMRLLDLLLVLLIGLSLALPVFLWMHPHWKSMLKLESAAQRLGDGHLEARIHFDNTSSLFRLGVAFNRMADNLNQLITSKKQLIDNIAHELRTPLVRLRYRLAMSDNLTEEEQQELNRDIGQLEALIDELLTYARLDRAQVTLHLTEIDFPVWLQTKVDDFRLIQPDKTITLDIPRPESVGALDLRLMERVLNNLVNNGLRFCRRRLHISLWLNADQTACLQVEDDGPGITPENRDAIFEPFVRLAAGIENSSGGCGLGLAIVHAIARAYTGAITVERSPLGGASFRFCWPIKTAAATLPLPHSFQTGAQSVSPAPSSGCHRT
ncbi:two-component system sensor histidine kinase RstB|uniref:histidine kinase n=1 Tax=Brenneria salicis ATCC 15712 = DSM 30166 TaxID=714314 RepID=A0A366IAI8_9GAMM|nr:two-component system sensor histidine kinase RstB [Brenneria salicis]NMN91816.1 two-component system sensor histidine kinase RstB [Brenneria salicis ATCC 15712 = DSM 30166]RBP65883.1 two-component system sensor histidine kinase RstB [Brenneria salicis ATCC 15712 = DSM 30166]RLM31912.1 two-component system sensor histidine kinase RstB [Brenneria salicis ATCC 15712 = DSM 30166]